MKKFLRGMLVVGAIVVAGISGMVFAGEKSNVVVTDSANKELVIKTVTITSGSATVASGLGTPTHALFSPVADSNGSVTSFKYVISSTDVIFYGYNPVTGATATTSMSGTGFIWGTP